MKYNLNKLRDALKESDPDLEVILKIKVSKLSKSDIVALMEWGEKVHNLKDRTPEEQKYITVKMTEVNSVIRQYYNQE